jgi:hypothetical protein
VAGSLAACRCRCGTVVGGSVADRSMRNGRRLFGPGPPRGDAQSRERDHMVLTLAALFRWSYCERTLHEREADGDHASR